MKLSQLFFSFFAISLFAIAQGPTASSSSSSQAATDVPTTDKGVTTVEVVKKKKRNWRVQGNFKGKDPMIPPDGQSNLPPTNGSRP